MTRARRGQQPVVLATDLDGTFLGGDAAARAALYDWIAQRRDEVVLIFVSGRGQAFMRELADTLPVRPDHCIGDVGTSVHSGPRLEPLREIEDWLDSTWSRHAHARIGETMRAHPQLREQQGCGGRRRSYLYDDAAATVPAAADVEALGFDALISDGRFFDVLPRGVQKGPTLLRTLAALGLSPQRTLVAGDTLNDLSMFDTGLCGVAVGNREPALERALHTRPKVYRARAEGAAGVLDALERFHAGEEIHGFVTGHRLSP